jgi:hypothetical protein
VFDWFLRYVLLRGLPHETVMACAAHPEIRALLKFRVIYLGAFHAPVLVPLLELLSGHHDPALGVFSLGLASLTMVLADVPTGLYADRRGPKAALRLGLQMTGLIMFGFFLLGMWRAWTLARGVLPGPWLPGIIGLLVLEAAIGVSLALLSGADTVLFLAVARRSQIPGLEHRGFEGIGSAIRYFGTMLAVVAGAILYDGITALIASPALRVALQNGLFLLTLFAMLSALRTLEQLPDLRDNPTSDSAHQLARPGFYAVARALREVLRWPRFFVRMWMLCLTSAASLFGVYVVQSPLSRLTSGLSAELPALWPLYTIIAAFGYWATSRGSHAFRRYLHAQPAGVDVEGERGGAATFFAVLSLLLLGLYPLMHFLTSRGAVAHARVWLLATAALLCLAYNYLRGFAEPYSATAIIAFTREKGLAVPVSLVSLFNSLKRGVHFGLSALFFICLQRAGGSGAGPDALLSSALLWLCLGFGALLLPALFLASRRSRHGA